MTTEWYSKDNLKKAWRYVNLDIFDDFVFDVINHDDIRYNIDHVISILYSQIKAEQYYPIPKISIGVPKNEHSVRPGSTIMPMDLIVLYAIAQQLAPLLDSCLSDSIYAYRLNPKAGKSNEHLFINKDKPNSRTKNDDNNEVINETTEAEIGFPYNWFRNWKAFHELSKEASKNHEYVAITDITAFFENISLDLLRELLKEKLNTSKRKLIDRLFRTLEYWGWTVDGNIPTGIGLLQGNDVSSFLSNLYLLDLDDDMLDIVKGNYKKYYRYVDDIKLFTSDKDEATRALVKLEETLRKLNLNVQSSKTKIIRAGEIFNPNVEIWLERMSDENTKKDKIDAGIEFFETVFSSSDLEKWERPYLRTLTVLKNANDDRAVDKALDLFLTNPSQKLLSKNFYYLLHFVSSRKYGKEIIDRLNKSKFTFPYHKAYIYRLAAYSRDEIDLLRKMAFDEALNTGSNWFCRMAALFCLSTFSLDKRELGQIVKLIETECNTQIMRAVYITLLQHSGKELNCVLDNLKFFNAPHQDYLRRYFFKFCEDLNFALKQLSEIKNIDLASSLFIHNLHRLDLLKISSNSSQRAIFKEVVEKKKQECNTFDWPRLSNRLNQIYDSFVVKV